MALTLQLTKQPWFKKLGKRSGTFFQMIKHLETSPGGWIIETGCAWHTGNWGGQGQSTLIWDWVIDQRPDIHCMSIDLSQEHVDTAMSQTKSVNYVCADSVKTLNDLDDALTDCRLLYLDSFDWSEALNLESAFHHMAELAACWRHLPAGCMIVVDDRWGHMRGKHWLVEGFMSKLGIKPAFCEYQIGWVKP